VRLRIIGASACIAFSACGFAFSDAHSELDAFFVDDVLPKMCLELPGLLLEMGTDKPLNNNVYCFTRNEERNELYVGSAHHYINTNHFLVAGRRVCQTGSISEGSEFKWLDWKPGRSALHLQLKHRCGAYGCEYWLSYSTIDGSSC
jgi:hypothetical protein